MVKTGLSFLLLLLVAFPVWSDDRPIGDQFAIAIERGDADAVQALIDGGASPDTWIEYGEHKITPLMKAAWEGNEDIVNLLIKAGTKVNASSSDSKETALMNAVTRGYTPIVKALLAADGDINPRNAYGFNAFTLAVSSKNQEIAEILLKAGAKIEEGSSGITPLSFAASNGDLDMIRFLVKHGADVNHGAKSGGQTTLLTAIYGAQLDVVKLLIQLKADVNTKTKGGDTPLSVAQKGDQTDIIAVLKAAGAKR